MSKMKNTTRAIETRQHLLEAHQMPGLLYAGLDPDIVHAHIDHAHIDHAHIAPAAQAAAHQALTAALDAQRFEATRQALSRRYHGAMDPISDEAVQAVLDGLEGTE